MKLVKFSLTHLLFFQLLGANAMGEDVQHRVTVNDSVTYPTMAAFLSAAFHEANRAGGLYSFDALCMEDCFSFSFEFGKTGEIRIKQYSKFAPGSVRAFIQKAIAQLNNIALERKPFVQHWLFKGYSGKGLLQPVVFAFFSGQCVPKSFIARGVLSLLTKDNDSGEFGTGPGMMSNLGDFNVEPFEGVLLPAVAIKSPVR